MQCAFCENESEYLCDFELGWSEWKSDGDRRVLSLEGEPITCDAPMCKECKLKVGIIFDASGCGTIETIDYCPIHKYSDSACIQHELSKGQSESIRLKDWKFRYYQRIVKLSGDILRMRRGGLSGSNPEQSTTKHFNN